MEAVGQLYKPGFFDGAGAAQVPAPWVTEETPEVGEDEEARALRMLRWRDDEGTSCLHLWAVAPVTPAASPLDQIDLLLERVAHGGHQESPVVVEESVLAALRGALEDVDIIGFTPLHLAALAPPDHGLQQQHDSTPAAVTHSGASQRLCLLERVARAIGADPAPVSYLWHCTPDDLSWLFQHGDESRVEQIGECRVERVRVWDRQRGEEEWLDVADLARKCADMRAYSPFYRGTMDYMRYMLTQVLGEDSVHAKKHRLLYAKDAARWDAEQHLVLCWIEEIAGFGVFAGRPFHQHEFIALYSGMLLPHDQLENTDYAFDTIIPGFGIDARHHRNIGGFINHSAIPNARSVSFLWRGAPCVAIVALRPIARGEQICYAYAQGASWFHHPTGKADQAYTELLGRPSFPSSLPIPRRSADGRRSPSPASTEEPEETKDQVEKEEEEEEVKPCYRCAVCLADESKGALKRCSRCHVFKYCSAECQKQDWPVHKKTCALLSSK